MMDTSSGSTGRFSGVGGGVSSGTSGILIEHKKEILFFVGFLCNTSKTP